MVRSSRGFTLIEILIVVGILGILTSIAVVAASSMTKSTRDARIRTNMENIQGLAEKLYTENNRYPSDFLTPEITGCAVQTSTTPNGDLLALAKDIRRMNGVTICAASTGAVSVNNSGTAYAVTAKLASGTFWCVDSLGTSKGGYTTQAAALTNGTDYTCN